MDIEALIQNNLMRRLRQGFIRYSLATALAIPIYSCGGDASVGSQADGIEEQEPESSDIISDSPSDLPGTLDDIAGNPPTASYCNNDLCGRIVFETTDTLGSDFTTPDEISVMNADGSDKTQLTHSISAPDGTTGNYNPEWSPDGKTIAFYSNIINRPSGIYLMNHDGTDVRKVPPDPTIGGVSPRWSPDGKNIVFGAKLYLETGSESVIFSVQPDGTGLTRISQTGKDDDFPVWSPMGDLIAFRSNNQESKKRIWVMKPDGSDRRMLNYFDFVSWPFHLSWSPNGTTISFDATSSYVASWNKLYTIRIDGTAVKELTDESLYSYQPVWSPTRDEIVFVSNDPANEQYKERLSIINGDGTNMRELYNSEKDDTTEMWPPSWSPDGNWIVFPTMDGDGFALSNNHYQLHVIRRDGTGLQNISNSDMDEREPRWTR